MHPHHTTALDQHYYSHHGLYNSTVQCSTGVQGLYSSSTKRQTNSLSPLSHISNKILVKVTVTESKIVNVGRKEKGF